MKPDHQSQQEEQIFGTSHSASFKCPYLTNNTWLAVPQFKKSLLKF